MSVLGDSMIEKLNELLKRHEKAVQYLDNMNIAAERKEKWLPEYEKLVQELNQLWDEIEK